MSDEQLALLLGLLGGFLAARVLSLNGKTLNVSCGCGPKPSAPAPTGRDIECPEGETGCQLF